jgi:hypothetical protein
MRGCEIHAANARAVQFLVSESFSAARSELRVVRSRVMSHSGSGAFDGVYVENSSAKDAVCVLEHCRLYAGIRDGVHALGADVDVEDGTVQGQRHGVYAEGGEIDIERTEIEGASDGIHGRDAYIDLSASSVYGEGNGIWASNSSTVAFGSEVGGDVSAMVCDGGRYAAVNAVFDGGGSSLVLRDEADMSMFDRCSILSWSTNAATPVIEVGINDGTNAPALELTGCLVRGMGTGPSVGLYNTATAGVSMVNCTLSQAPAAGVALLPPASTLPYGNHVIPAPESWKVMLGED